MWFLRCYLKMGAAILLGIGACFMPRLSVRLWKEQRGQDMLEYALLLLLIALSLVASTRGLSVAIQSVFQGITDTVSAATTGGGSGNQGGSGGN